MLIENNDDKQENMRENTISNTNKSYISTAASINVNKKAKTSANDLNQRIDKMSNVVTPKLKTESIKFGTILFLFIIIRILGIQGYKSFYNFKKYSIEPMRKNTEIQMTDYVDRSKLFMNSLKEFMKTNKNKMVGK